MGRIESTSTRRLFATHLSRFRCFLLVQLSIVQLNSYVPWPETCKDNKKKLITTKEDEIANRKRRWHTHGKNWETKMKGGSLIYWLYCMHMTYISPFPKPQCVGRLKTCESNWIWISAMHWVFIDVW